MIDSYNLGKFCNTFDLHFSKQNFGLLLECPFKTSFTVLTLIFGIHFLNINTQLSSGIRILDDDHGLHPRPYFLCTISEDLGETAQARLRLRCSSKR